MRSRYSFIVLMTIFALGQVTTSQRAAAQDPEVSGFHVGVFGGAVVIDSTVNFPATDTRPAAKFVDQGGDGFIFGLRAGWGGMVGTSVYAGFEGELLIPYNVTSRLEAFGAEYRARLRNEFGVYGRIGWVSYGRSMVFLRAGLSVPRQNFESVQGGNSASGADFTLVPTFGGGAEMNFSSRLFGRMDVTYSWPSGTNAIESYRVSAGLGVRF